MCPPRKNAVAVFVISESAFLSTGSCTFHTASSSWVCLTWKAYAKGVQEGLEMVNQQKATEFTNLTSVYS